MDKKEPGNKKRNWRVLPLFIISILLVLELFGSACFFSSVFGIPCAGCGSTRALSLLLQGRFGEAIRMHPLILVSLLLLILVPGFALVRFIASKRGKDIPFPLSSKASDIVMYSLAGLYLAVYIIRMILFFPHTEPMCYNHNSVWGQIIALLSKVFGR